MNFSPIQDPLRAMRCESGQGGLEALAMLVGFVVTVVIPLALVIFLLSKIF